VTIQGEIRPGYNQTEVGIIPEDWDALPLGQIGNFKNGINKPAEAFGLGYPFVNLMDVFSVDQITSVVNLGLLESTPLERSTYNLRTGDVLFIRSSVKPSGVGLTTVVTKDLEDTVFSGFLLRFRDRGQLTPQFKKYCFLDSRFRDAVIASSTVSANTNINQSSLKKIYLAFPRSLTEQRAIAAALADTDALIAALEGMIAKKRDLKQAAMQHLLTGKTRLPGFSGEWEVKRLGEIFQLTMAGSKSYFVREAGDFWVVDMGSVTREGKLTVSKPTDARDDLLSVGDLVMPKDDIGGGNIIGRVAYIDQDNKYICGDHVYRMTCLQGSSKFFSYLINSDPINKALRKKVVGSAQLGLGRQSVLGQELFTPPTAEQTAIAEVLSDMDADLAALEVQAAKARAVKQGMMQELLTGRIRLI
jgi:type I restriction enzyme S subunit